MEEERLLERELQAATLAGRRISFSQARDPLLFVQCGVASLETIYTHTTKTDSGGCYIYLSCVCVCDTHTHIANNIVKEKGYQFMSGRHRRGSREGNREGLEGRKEGSNVILF